MDKPFSQSCENNKLPILQVISEVYVKPVEVLEIGSGTGQHACYFAQKLPHITWQCSDLRENIPGIDQWVAEAELTNLNPPLELDVTMSIWPVTEINALFSANTLHIISWSKIEILFQRLQRYLHTGARCCFYGPFNYQGNYTSDSNARFDQWLKTREPLSGIRDFEAIQDLAQAAGMRLIDDIAMPANNRLSIWQKER